MKIYFTASIVGKRHYLGNYQKIISYLKSLNHEVISDHIINTTESQIRMEESSERIKFQKQLEDWIKSADAVVVEASFPSISVGYEISLAVHFGKPVLILHCDGNPPSLLVHHSDEKIICEKYTVDTLLETIDDFLSYAQGASDSRFTFYITSKIAAYLNEVSQKKKIPKSVYLRRLIEKEMEK